MKDYVQAALAKSLDEMGFSDHFIMIYLPQEAVQDDYCMKEEELPLYVEGVRELQEKHSDILIKLGIEVDYYEGKEEEIRNLLRSIDFDYIYGSIHVVDNVTIDDDRFRYKLKKYTVDELYQKYFTILKKAIQSGLFDIMAHLDLPKKYGDRPTEPLDELLDEVIEALVKNNVCVELNTGGFRKPVKEQYPSIEILQKCYENDVQVTLGSDSHHPKEVGWELDRALNILRKVGYSQINGFEKRKRLLYDI